MTTSNPEYLRLHIEEETLPQFLVEKSNTICQNLEVATGWEFEFQKHDSEAGINEQNLSACSGTFEIVDLSAEAIDGQQPLHRDKAESIATAANSLVQQIEKSKTSVRRLQAELATHVPVIHRPDESTVYQQLLENLLATAAEIAGCNKASLFMLDDSTSTLQNRAAIGLTESKIGDANRPLEKCVADIEAIVGHAVAIEDVSQLPHWKVPVACASAICVPVSTLTTPLGTLWIFGDEIRDYDSATINMIEIIAGRIAAELQFLSAMNQFQDSLRQQATKSDPISTTIQRRKPNLLPPLDEVSISIKEIMQAEANQGVVDWSFKEDGRLWLFSASSDPTKPNGAEIAQAMQSAFCAIRNLVDSPAALVENIVDAICRLEPEQAWGQIHCCLIDYEHNQVVSCSTGATERWVDFETCGRPIEESRDVVSGECIDISTSNAGWQIEWR